MSKESLSFWKYEGIGNDFIVVEREHVPAALRSPQALGGLCDRHVGIGADGVLVLSHAPLRMSIVNADGSAAEMCGNGLRCAVLHWLLQHPDKLSASDNFIVETDAGPHRCRVLNARAGSAQVEVDMAPPITELKRLPVDLDAWPEASERANEGRLLDVPLSLEEHALRLSVVSLGNPHAVTFDVTSEALRGFLGPAVESHPAFVEGANVGFAHFREPNTLDLRVWERGAGWTLACGTGACAAAVAAVLTDRAPVNTWLTLQLPGGALEVWVGATGAHVTMRGPARRVFDGRVGGA